MSGEYTDAERAATRAWLDAMPPAEACAQIAPGSRRTAPRIRCPGCGKQVAVMHGKITIHNDPGRPVGAGLCLASGKTPDGLTTRPRSVIDCGGPTGVRAGHWCCAKHHAAAVASDAIDRLIADADVDDAAADDPDLHELFGTAVVAALLDRPGVLAALAGGATAWPHTEPGDDTAAGADRAEQCLRRWVEAGTGRVQPDSPLAVMRWAAAEIDRLRAQLLSYDLRTEVAELRGPSSPMPDPGP